MGNEQFAMRDDPQHLSSGIEVSEIDYFGHEKDRLAGAINASLQFAGSFTDLLICEGEPVSIKSAQGVVGLGDMKIPGSDMVVTHLDIQNFFCYFLDGLMLPLFFGVLSSLLTRSFCAVPRTSVARIAWD